MKHPPIRARRPRLRALAALLLLLPYISACTNDVIVPDQPITEQQTHPHAISIDDALAYLNEFISSENNSRSNHTPRTVKDVHTIKYQSVRSRSAADIDCDNLLYAVNFDGNQGYAVLAADDRIQDKVIAVIDSGNYSGNKFEFVGEKVTLPEYYFPDYPLSGPGFFQLEEYDNEWFINPNTANPYIEAEQDTLVGNFSVDNVGELDENGILVNPNDTTVIDSPNAIMEYLIVTYALDQLTQTPPDETTDPIEPPHHEFIQPGNGGNGGGPYLEEITPWENIEFIEPLLAPYSIWSQSQPLNNLFPKRRRYLLFGHKRTVPAGCFPMAIAKIMTHFEYPQSLTPNGTFVNWSSIKRDHLIGDGATSIAALLRFIADGCNSWFFYQGTFTFPGKAKSFMSKIGIGYVQSSKYDFTTVTRMLKRDRPLIIYAIPGINIFNSHAWNIDGYKIKERTITKKELVSTTTGYEEKIISTTVEHYDMVHCDFGWHGENNGYYVSGVFNLKDPRIEHDGNDRNKKEYNFNSNIRLITYIL